MAVSNCLDQAIVSLSLSQVALLLAVVHAGANIAAVTQLQDKKVIGWR